MFHVNNIFRSVDAEIGRSKYSPDYCCPIYVDSPYMSWLNTGDPEDSIDITSYFRATATRNLEIEKTLILSSEGKKSPVNGKNIFKYWNDNYWVINQEGYGPQGQKDCKTNELINAGYVPIVPLLLIVVHLYSFNT